MSYINVQGYQLGKKILPPLDNQKKMYPLGIFNYLNRVGQQTLVKQNLPAGFILILTHI